jgi:hypothetical protein
MIEPDITSESSNRRYIRNTFHSPLSTLILLILQYEYMYIGGCWLAGWLAGWLAWVRRNRIESLHFP